MTRLLKIIKNTVILYENNIIATFDLFLTRFTKILLTSIRNILLCFLIKFRLTTYNCILIPRINVTTYMLGLNIFNT